jgi:hypothetical protein
MAVFERAKLEARRGGEITTVRSRSQRAPATIFARSAKRSGETFPFARSESRKNHSEFPAHLDPRAHWPGA